MCSNAEVAMLPDPSMMITIFVILLGSPRILEWNIFNIMAKVLKANYKFRYITLKLSVNPTKYVVLT